MGSLFVSVNVYVDKRPGFIIFIAKIGIINQASASYLLILYSINRANNCFMLCYPTGLWISWFHADWHIFFTLIMSIVIYTIDNRFHHDYYSLRHESLIFYANRYWSSTFRSYGQSKAHFHDWKDLLCKVDKGFKYFRKRLKFWAMYWVRYGYWIVLRVIWQLYIQWFLYIVGIA